MDKHTSPTITRENLKMIGVPEPIHTKAKLLAARDRLPMYAVVAEALRLYEKFYEGDNHANN
jgi:hypothetical protein